MTADKTTEARLVVYVDKASHEWVRRQAFEERVSVAEYMRRLLDDARAAKKASR